LIDSIKSHYDRRAWAAAFTSEASDLQYRVSITGFLLKQRFGTVTKDYLLWIRPKLTAYKGNEVVESIRQFTAMLLEAPDEQLIAITERMRAEPGIGMSLKNFNASLIESNLSLLSSFPVDYQQRIHEFRSHLSVLNQEIDRAKESLRMTFSSMSDENHDRLVEDLNSKYVVIERMCQIVSDRLQAILDYDTKKI
jgi:hypothetical protein